MDIIGSENVLIHFSYKWVLNSFLSTLVFLSLDIHSHKMNIEIQSPLYYYNQMEHANYYYIVCDMYFNTFHFAKLHFMLLHSEKPVKDTIFLNLFNVIWYESFILRVIFVRIQLNFVKIWLCFIFSMQSTNPNAINFAVLLFSEMVNFATIYFDK